MSALNRVADALLKYPGTRDNDRMLCSMVWRDELIADGRDVNEMYAPDFFLAYLYTLTDAATITRCRRQLQLTNPELRGDKWNGKALDTKGH